MAQHRRSGRPYRRLRAWVRSTQPICWLCGKPWRADVPPRHRLAFSLDHVIPLDEGGSLLDPTNARAAHYGCNAKRGLELVLARRLRRRAALPTRPVPRRRTPKRRTPLVTSRDW